MASPFLANAAIGYVKQQQADRIRALQEQAAREAEQRAIEVEVEKKKRLDALAFESAMQQDVVRRGMNQQGNARIAQQYEEIAKTSTDPIVRKNAKKWANVYANAGDMDTESVETMGKNLSPEKSENKSVQDLEFERKQRNEAMLQTKLNDMMQLDFQALEGDEKLRQRTFLELSKGLDSDYLDEAREAFDGFFPKPIKMPDHMKNAEMAFRTNWAKYYAQLNAVVQGKGDIDSLTGIEAEVNQIAETLNDWLVENGQDPQYPTLVDTDNDPETPSEVVKPGYKMGPSGQSQYKVNPKKKSPVPVAPMKPAPQQKGDWKARAQEIKTEHPEFSPAQIAQQLRKEGY